MKLIFSFVLITISSSLFAQNYMNLNKFLADKYDSFIDISYTQIHPQYEENQPANKGVILEYYTGEFDGSEKSKANIQYIKSILHEEKRLNSNISVPTLIYGKDLDSIENSSQIKYIQESLTLNAKTKIEVIPNEINFNYTPKSDGRSPNSIKIGRVGWTFIRGVAVTGSTFASLIITQGLSAPLAASVSIWPGILSGALTYHNGLFGDYLTNGKWAKWLMNSDKWFAKKLRTSFNINYESLGKRLAQNPRYFRVKYPNLYKSNPDLFENFIEQKARSHGKNKFKQLLSKLVTAEEYLKWYVTEVAFVGGVIKIPQAIAGIGTTTGILSSTSDVLLGSFYGMVAQGPGDIAIQKRKFQKLDELLLEVQSDTKNRFTASEKSQIIKEVSDIKDPKIKFQIGKNSHKALQKIENWARSRTTVLSFMSVMGVTLEMAGIPAAKPILISVGVAGSAYYAQVSGWIKFENIKTVAKSSAKSFGKFLKNPIGTIYANITKRICQYPFMLPKF